MIPLRDEQQKILGAIVVNQDITNIKLSEIKLKQSAEALARSNRELQTFVYTASHDLQEPLRKIQAFGDRLHTRTQNTLDEQAQDYLKRMINAASRMQLLIEDLLVYSRVTTKGDQFEAVDLNAVLSSVVADLEVAIEKAQAHIEIEPLTSIEADKSQIHQLFQNLLSNAIKFRAPERVPIIRVAGRFVPAPAAASQPAMHYEVTVADNGDSFEQKYAEQIFGMFQRLHETRRI
ncbi:MAG: histidine kinase dimerization/phospho-acceptor domain-containing protein [Anaerolineae bacterium]